MNDSKNTTDSETAHEGEDLARLYMDLWQKQMTDLQTSPLARDMNKASELVEESYKEMLSSIDTPEKAQNWMTSWTKAFFEQVAKGMQQNGVSPAAAPWTVPFGAASTDDAETVDDLKNRIAVLEDRVATLEQQLAKGRKGAS